MLKAEICKNRIQLEGWDSRDDLLAKLRNLCGSEPDEVTTLRTGEVSHVSPPYRDTGYRGGACC